MTLTAGIHAISFADYLADPAPEPSLSASIAHILITQSPRHAWHAHPRLNPEHAPENSTIADAGTVAHHVLLQGDERDLVIVQADDWRTKAAKEARDEAWARGAIPVLECKMDEVHRMVAAARLYIKGSEIAEAFNLSAAEQTMLWQDGSIWLKSRPDLLWQNGRTVIDYKTTGGSAEPNVFAKQIVNMGYDLQAAIGLDGMATLFPREGEPRFLFLVQENTPPYACSLIGLDPMMLDLATRRLAMAKNLWRACMNVRAWPGYPSRICYVSPPNFAMTQQDEREMIDEQQREWGIQS